MLRVWSRNEGEENGEKRRKVNRVNGEIACDREAVDLNMLLDNNNNSSAYHRGSYFLFSTLFLTFPHIYLASPNFTVQSCNCVRHITSGMTADRPPSAMQQQEFAQVHQSSQSSSQSSQISSVKVSNH